MNSAGNTWIKGVDQPEHFQGALGSRSFRIGSMPRKSVPQLQALLHLQEQILHFTTYWRSLREGVIQTNENMADSAEIFIILGVNLAISTHNHLIFFLNSITG